MYRTKEVHSLSRCVVQPENPESAVIKLIYNEIIGEGVYGMVRKGFVENQNKQKSRVAFKITSSGIPSANLSLIQEASRMIKMRGHPSILDVFFCYPYQSVLDRTHTIMCMELFQSSDMYNSILKKGFTYSLKLATVFSIKMLEAIKLLRINNIVHLDLKPENVMFYALEEQKCREISHPSKSELPPSDIDSLLKQTELKIIDFGCSMTGDQELKNNYVQTRFYRSPLTIFTNSISEKDDLFSVGAILYEMISGVALFSVTQGIIQHYPEDLQTSQEKEAHNARNLAHLYAVKILLNQPSDATLARLPQERVNIFYKEKEGHYTLKPLPIKSARDLSSIKEHLEKERQIQFETLENNI